MNCLIVAAGYGSRLRPLSDSKPLTPVNGVPLIEHVIRSAVSAGIDEFVVATGHRAEEVEAFLAQLGSRLGVGIEPVRCADWSRPNGCSVLDGSEEIDADYLLLMADHLFDPAIAERLLSADAAAGLLLAVDRDLANPMIDMDDATKVDTGGGSAIRAIGKQLADYDAIDTGIFRCGPALREALLEVAGEGRDPSLSEGVQRLADRQLASVVDIGKSWWIDVDDPRAHALAEAHLAALPGFRENAA